MRLLPLPPGEMRPSIRALHNDMALIVADYLEGFVSRRTDRVLTRPFPPMLHLPALGEAGREYTKAFDEKATLLKPLRNMVILATGASLTRAISCMRMSTQPKARACRMPRLRQSPPGKVSRTFARVRQSPTTSRPHRRAISTAPDPPIKRLSTCLAWTERVSWCR